MSSYLEKIKEKTSIDLKSLVFGSAIFTVIATFGFMNNIAILFTLSAIGLIYTGYYAKNLEYGAILGAIGSIPLIIIASYGYLMPINNIQDMLMIVIGILFTGAIIGLLGAYVKRSREGRLKEQAKKAKIGKKKKKKN